ncbi:adaptin N terminal region-domain-containing protein [Syncephalis pseudoplumigaleata]|uniref:Adaptin N terminal region-domain-containing protein n=1 Tax=Syncephalis pseudoplumigaleata TaxID=1712513 RepID=A0A4P9YRK7_9FUNG|nr:adaptin N terminal region-domain-containing protein [Syncephalis pseudoplumigaleata]|eukprot:RKP22533.1 adaptin N terminal region-domain-containing protein [Syncephalis pseudoplumigaleata]
MYLQRMCVQVVMAVISLLFHIGTQEDIAKVALPLARILHGSREVEYTVLLNVKSIVEARPELLAGMVKPFYLRVTDPVIIGRLKLEILTAIVTDATAQNVADELFAYIKFPRKELAVLVVKAIGRFITRQPTYTNVCLRQLMHFYKDDNALLVGEIAAVTQHVLAQQTDYVSADDMKLYLTYIIGIFFTTPSAAARANIVWLASHYMLRRLDHDVPMPSLPQGAVDCVVSYAPNILRELVRRFPDEDGAVKVQALRLGLISALTGTQVERALFLHLIELARYDLSYDIRDCARWIRGLAANRGIAKDADGSKEHDGEGDDADGQMKKLSHPVSFHWYRYIGSFTATAKKAAVPATGAEKDGEPPYTIGSMSLVVHQPMAGYEPLPDWPAEQPDPSVRGVPEPVATDTAHGKAAASTALTNARKMWMGSNVQDLDEFYDTTEGDTEEDDDEEEEEAYTTTEEEEEDELIADSYEASSNDDEEEEEEDDDDEVASQQSATRKLLRK